MIMGDYKDFGGIKMPTKRVQKLPMAEVVMNISNVEFDNCPPRRTHSPTPSRR